MPKPKTKLEYSLVCDDVRREENGKLIIIGVYGSDILLNTMPATLRLSYVLGLSADSTGPSQIKVRALQDGKQIFEATGDINFHIPNSITISALTNIFVNVTKDTMLDFRVQLNDGRFRSACKLPIRKRS